jgi:hypothetical protein
VEVDRAAAEVENERRATGAGGRRGAEHRRIGLTRDDSSPLLAKLGEGRDEVGALAAREEGDRDGPPAGEPAGEARVFRRRGQGPPDDVEETIAVAGHTADRSDLAGCGRIRALVEPVLGAICPNEDDRSVARPPAARRGCRTDDDRRSAAGDGAGGGAGGARFLGVEPEQEAEPQRIREHGNRRAGLGDLDGGQRSERQLARVPDLVDDRQRSVEAISDQDAVVALDDGGRDAPAALAGFTQPGCRSIEVLAPHNRDHLAGGGWAAEVLESRQPSGAHARARRRLAPRSRDRRPLESELLDPAKLEQAGLDGVKVSEESERRTRAEPALSPEQQLRDAPDAVGGAFRAGRRAPADEQPARLVPGFDACDGYLGRRVADIDAGDQHPLRRG